MIVLDTNVLSEILRLTPEARVLSWLQAQPRTMLFTTTITRGEMFYGVQLLPEGKRKASMLAEVRAIFAADFAGQILAFDNDAADAYAEISATRKTMGKPIAQLDAMIAAIALSRGARLATRNIKDFVGCGVEIINPWDE
ncbi:MAG: type II toxin-antitoxin system VapC family toxin [Azoarcus sp.]|jgi:predicted nucleic acid-binding protein|nr:type II toxin-antitoxin system VapC family toxin [Azoarcus sp.]